MFSARPTDFEARTKSVASSAINAARKTLVSADIKQALTDRSHADVLEAAGKALDVLTKRLGPGLEAVLKEVMATSGDMAAKTLKKRLRSLRAATAFRTSVIKGWNFDSTNPRAVDWVKKHTADLVKGITDDTRDQIRDVVEEAFTDQFDVDVLSDEIADIIGDDVRADVIARTETMTASNQGQLEAWDQATEAGLLTGDEQKEWITTPDDRLCPVCEPMDGVTVGMDEDFDVDGDTMDGPPAHPNCRCTVGLSLGD